MQTTKFCVRIVALSSLCQLSMLGVAQTQIYAADFAFKSTGGVAGNDYNLWSNGHIGTFLTLQKSGRVVVRVMASGQPASGVWPEMGLHVGNRRFVTTVASAATGTYDFPVDLPAGTSSLRIEFHNDRYDPENNEDRNLILRQVDLLARADLGVKVLNPTTTDGLRQAIFAAADTSIEAYRKQSVEVKICDAKGRPLPKNTEVRVHLRRHAFNFGTAVGGIGDSWDLMWPHPAAGSDAARYQAAVAENFTSIEPENAGKWDFNERVRGRPTMEYVDAILGFARTKGQRVRFHTFLWGAQQPDWVSQLETDAQSSDPVVAQRAADDLWNAIVFRAGYVIRDRGASYDEMDGINEASAGHQPVFLNIYGYSGIAKLYNLAIDQLRASGSRSPAYFNDYNILNNDGNAYATWYLDFMRNVIEAGVTPANRSRLGVGIQYYNIGGVDHNPIRIYQSLANLGTVGAPLSLTEFGLGEGETSSAPQVLQETLHLIFGNDQATTFNCWGFWQPTMWVSGAALYDRDWNLTNTGRIWQQMTGVRDWGLPGVPKWTTNLTLRTGADGTVNFPGFAGQYSISVGSQSVPLKVAIGTRSYRVLIPASGGRR